MAWALAYSLSGIPVPQCAVSVVACAFFCSASKKQMSMDTVENTQPSGIAFINDPSPILDKINDDLIASGFEIPFHSKNFQEAFSQLSVMDRLPKICIIDLNFNNERVLADLQELKSKYPDIRLIAHSDTDTKRTVASLVGIGIDGYLLMGSDVKESKIAISGVLNNKKYFSAGVSEISRKYFENK